MLILGAVGIEQVDMSFQIGGGHGQGGIREFVNDADGPVFMEWELKGLSVDG